MHNDNKGLFYSTLLYSILFFETTTRKEKKSVVIKCIGVPMNVGQNDTCSGFDLRT